MEGELFQGGVLMHSYLRAVGFSRITKRSSIRQIITDVVETYDEKTVIENYLMVCLQSFPRIMDAIVELLSAGSMMKTTYFIRIIIFLFSRNRHYNTGECCDRKTCRQRIFCRCL